MTHADDIELEDEPAANEPPLPTGTQVDAKYTIVRTLGRGGTGTVYEAQHTVIGHRVALKIVNTDRAERPETLARFQREAKICGTIRHPNVGQIYDVGMYDGKPYMVLELHEGQSLADVLDESVLPIAAVIEIALQVLSALAAIHDVRVVHRDVKPDNVMLVRSLSGDIVVKLVDFGISKVITTDISERTLTREGSILGSPDYMSPEQLRGQEVDARTDLYAVGVLLYQAITGSTPFDAENLSDLMAAILRDPVLPPRELRNDCPVELDTLTLKAMSRDPADRFQSAVDMARQLEQARNALRYTPEAGMGHLRKPLPPRAERVTRMSRKPPVPSIKPLTVTPVIDRIPGAPARGRLVWGLGFAALLIVIAAFALQRTADTPAREIARAAEVAAPPTPARRAEQPTMTAMPVAVSADTAIAANARSQAHQLEPSSKLKRERGAQPKPTVEATVDVKSQLAEASSAFVLGQMPRAKTLYQQILERSPAQPDAWRGLGLVASRMGQRKDAERAFERYLELRPNAPDAERIREQLEKVR